MATVVDALPRTKSTATALGTAVPLDVLTAPGAYVCNWSGHLLRVKDATAISGRCPTLNMVGSQPLTVTKISENPDIPLSQAKKLAAKFDLKPNF